MHPARRWVHPCSCGLCLDIGASERFPVLLQITGLTTLGSDLAYKVFRSDAGNSATVACLHPLLQGGVLRFWGFTFRLGLAGICYDWGVGLIGRNHLERVVSAGLYLPALVGTACHGYKPMTLFALVSQDLISSIMPRRWLGDTIFMNQSRRVSFE